MAVAVFTSTFVNKIDRKGRVSVPASFRTALGGNACAGIFIYRPFEGVRLEGCDFDRMNKMSQSLDQLRQFSKEYELLQSIFADSMQAAIDTEGRIILSDELREYAGIDDTVTFIGAGPVFQMWSPARYAEHRLRTREKLLASNAEFPPFATITGPAST